MNAVTKLGYLLLGGIILTTHQTYASNVDEAPLGEAVERHLSIDTEYQRWAQHPDEVDTEVSDEIQTRETLEDALETVKLAGLVPDIHFETGVAQIPAPLSAIRSSSRSVRDDPCTNRRSSARRPTSPSFWTTRSPRSHVPRETWQEIRCAPISRAKRISEQTTSNGVATTSIGARPNRRRSRSDAKCCVRTRRASSNRHFGSHSKRSGSCSGFGKSP